MTSVDWLVEVEVRREGVAIDARGNDVADRSVGQAAPRGQQRRIDGAPVEYGDHCYRAEDYSIDVTLDER